MGRTGSPGCSGAGCGLRGRRLGRTGDGREPDGEVERINLESEEGIRSYSGHGYTLEVNLRPDGQPGVRVEHADCPTQDCVHTGIITRAGQSIVCLPARIIIRLEGGSEPDGGPDLIIG